jgi:hypothetical protein
MYRINDKCESEETRNFMAARIAWRKAAAVKQYLRRIDMYR